MLHDTLAGTIAYTLLIDWARESILGGGLVNFGQATTHFSNPQDQTVVLEPRNQLLILSLASLKRYSLV